MITAPGVVSNKAGDGGYHTYFTSGNNEVDFAWIGNDGVTDDLTSVLSHEVVESISDALVGNGVTVTHGAQWKGGGDNEIADAEAQYHTACGTARPSSSRTGRNNGAYVIPTLTSQEFVLTNGKLVVQGDQLANHNDSITISVSGSDMVVNENGDSLHVILDVGARLDRGRRQERD